MSVRRNIISNFAFTGLSAVMALTFVPLYIRFLGIEAYGLIGVYVSLVGVLSVFDLGLSTTLNRELARLSATHDAEQQARELTRTFEAIYWLAGILIGGGVAILAPAIARNWLNVEGLAVELVEQSAIIMGLALALQWPVSLYAGGLMGLQRQVLLNAVRAAAAILQSGGAVLVLWLVSPTIVVYFVWQMLCGALHTVAMGACLWMSLPQPSRKAAFRSELLVRNRRFAGGITGIAILVVLLTQADKIVLSKKLSLEMFGYYSLATAVAGVMSSISSPVVAALFPRLSQGAAGSSEAETALLYHKGAQLMTALVAPGWVTLALFSEQLLTLWIRDPPTVANTHSLVSLLVTGTALNCIVSIPYALQLAYAWTSLMLHVNVISVVLFVPLLIWLVAGHGAIGAALAWIALNAGYVLVVVPLMHGRLLKGNLGRWYIIDCGCPTAVGFAVGGIARLTMPADMPPVALLLWILSALALTFISVALAMPHTREWLRARAFCGAADSR